MSLSVGVQGRHHKEVKFKLDFEGQDRFIRDRRAFQVVEERHDALHRRAIFSRAFRLRKLNEYSGLVTGLN